MAKMAIFDLNIGKNDPRRGASTGAKMGSIGPNMRFLGTLDLFLGRKFFIGRKSLFLKISARSNFFRGQI